MTRATQRAASAMLPLVCLTGRSGEPPLTAAERQQECRRRTSAGVVLGRFLIHRPTVEAALRAAGRIATDGVTSVDDVAEALAHWVADLLAATQSRRGDPLMVEHGAEDLQAERVARKVVASLAEAAQRYVSQGAPGA